MIKKLRYGNTNTFYIQGDRGGLMVDTGYAGSLPAFFRALKAENMGVKDISFIMATHYHPDHCGLIGKLQELGVKLLVWDVQTESVSFSDYIFEREKADYRPADLSSAVIVSCEDSRSFLENLGIRGEVISLPSHSPDSVAVMLDDGDCVVGDLEPLEYFLAYSSNPALQQDWAKVLSRSPKRILYAHANERSMASGTSADPRV